MIVLGFDTATHATSVGLRLADGSALRATDDPAPDEHPGHATRLLSMARRLLGEADIEWASVDRIAVGLGPGRFTGLRVGSATARGLAQALSLELVGISTLRALAEGPSRAAPGVPGAVVAVIDARRGEVFAQGYPRAPGAALDGLPARALEPHELAAALRGGEAAGTAGGWLAVGDGALRYRAELQSAGAEVPEAGSPLHLVDGSIVCELGARGRPALRYEDVAPDYRRAPDAEGPRPGTNSPPRTALEAVR